MIITFIAMNENYILERSLVKKHIFIIFEFFLLRKNESLYDLKLDSNQIELPILM
jgi:hypothetical protein